MHEDWLEDVLPERPTESVRFLSRADIAHCLRKIDAVSVVEAALVEHHAGRSVLPSESYLPWRNSKGAYSRSIGMPGAVLPEKGEQKFGMKIINASVSNPELGMERAGGLGLCFDPETARVTTCMEAGLLSAVRTAVVSAVAVRTAGFAAPERLAVIGCGTQAKVHLALFLSRWPGIREVVLHDSEPHMADKLSAWCAARRPDIVVETADTTAKALAEADVVLFLTTASEGYVPSAWVRPGSLLVNTSLGDLTDEVFLGSDQLYVDDLQLITENPRRPLGRLVNERRILADDTPGRPSVTATFGELLSSGRTGTRPESGYTVANPFGLGVLDVALYHAVAEQAAQTDIGRTLRLH
ncbi:hypothetical protein ACQEU8_21285 [Streptomyces sp. CA-250714]|uniref:hypothetical protein n=1 Tax=Streptomyces sp. CA-250714 TaxID=3240060 RepID=UPI003D92B1AA